MIFFLLVAKFIASTLRPTVFISVRYRTQTAARNIQILSMLKTVQQTKMAAHVEIGRFRCQSSSFLIRSADDCAVQFQRPSRLRVVVDSFELKRPCSKNDLTDTVLCLNRQCLQNICKLKRQTTTVRYSVAIIMFWWQIFGDGDHSFTAWRHKLTIRTTFPKNCGVVGRVMKYNRGHLI